jgi:Ca2+-binding RTX toxin-like protein
VTLSYTVEDSDGATATASFVLTVTGENDARVIIGTNGANALFGTDAKEIIQGLGGDDTIFGRGGDDVIDAGDGKDYVFGGAGNDIIDGGAGNDILFGDEGDDILAGGAGNDQLYGGAGNDTFVFKPGEGNDIVFDFQAGAGAGDVLELDRTAFADFAALMQSGAVADTSGGAQISYADGSKITLAGVHKADLAIDDFRFV